MENSNKWARELREPLHTPSHLRRPLSHGQWLVSFFCVLSLCVMGANIHDAFGILIFRRRRRRAVWLAHSHLAAAAPSWKYIFPRPCPFSLCVSADAWFSPLLARSSAVCLLPLFSDNTLRGPPTLSLHFTPPSSAKLTPQKMWCESCMLWV
jgi:hypothetical protein